MSFTAPMVPDCFKIYVKEIKSFNIFILHLHRNRSLTRRALSKINPRWRIFQCQDDTKTTENPPQIKHLPTVVTLNLNARKFSNDSLTSVIRKVLAYNDSTYMISCQRRVLQMCTFVKSKEKY